MPALVVRGADGQIETVKYHELATLLLNELIKQHAVIEKQNATIEQQNDVKSEMNMRLAPLEAQRRLDLSTSLYELQRTG